MSQKLLAAVGLVLATALSCPGADEAAFAFRKDVIRPSGPAAQDDILAATLDSDVYEATSDTLADLRVFDARGKETPYQLQQATEDRTQTVQQPRAMTILRLKEDKDNNRVELLLVRDRPAGETKMPPIDGLTFFTPLRDYERRVTVSGSDDQADWKPLVADAVIFDYSRFVDLANSQVALPSNHYRYLKVVIDEMTDAEQSPLTEFTREFRGSKEQRRIERTTTRRRPLRIDHIEYYENVSRTLARQQKKSEYPVRFDPKKDVTEDAKQKQTILEIGSRREPLTQFTLATPDVNFSRRVSVLVPVARGVATDWVPVGGGTINVIRFRGFGRQSLPVTFPRQRQKRYRVVIANRDDPPLAITGVSAEGSIDQAVFFAAKGANYRLAYGCESAAAPDYDTSALAETLASGYQPVAAALGRQMDNPQFGGDSRPWLRRALGSPLVLGGTIAVMVVVLTLILFRAGRRIEGLPEE